jgi:radical SAM protein with 4Fe4S-binding SPASM domain
MDIYKNIEYLKKADYAKYLYFTGSKYPRLFYYIKTLGLYSDLLFQTRYSRPLMIICETVNICSNECIICPYSKMTRKKEIMPLKLFEKVLRDYSEMGGGKLSLTPMVGDIFLDKFLPERLAMIKKYPKITGVSVTTNTILSDQYTDTQLEEILNSFERIHISVYGIDDEEYSLMTRRNTYSQMIKNIRRIIQLTKKTDSLLLGFRFLKERAPAEIHEWIMNNLGKDIHYGQTNEYTDWGGSVDSAKPLPFFGVWCRRKGGQSHCLLPLSCCMIFSNGDVSFCPCIDFDIKREFLLGNISNHSLGQILNSSKNKRLWASPANLPRLCRTCVSYRSFEELSKCEYIFENPIDFIGG